VRRLAARALHERGYVVLEAGDGDAALEMLGRHPETRMLVTDVVMPRLGGVELAARVRNARPDLRVLFLSGYPGDLVLRSEEERRRYAFMPKPFTSKTLALKVGEMFEDGGGEPAANPRPKSPS
jgi:two-component system, cell cycle sensor histidine kinase and response regulator CckA